MDCAVERQEARINCISHILSSIPYERVAFEKPNFCKRQKRPGDFVEDTTLRNVVPEVL